MRSYMRFFSIKYFFNLRKKRHISRHYVKQPHNIHPQACSAARKTTDIPHHPAKVQKKENRYQLFVHVLPCRHVHFVISIPCFVPQHFIPTPTLTYPLSVPHVRGDFITSATKYQPAQDGWYFLARWSTVVLANFTDFAIFRIRVYQDKKHPHIRYLSPFGVCNFIPSPLTFPTLTSGLFSFSATSFPQKE